MKRLVLSGIVILSFLGFMVGTAQAWRGGWGRGSWVTPAITGSILGSVLANAANRAYYPRPVAYRYPAEKCPSTNFCEEHWHERLPLCVECYPKLYKR